MLGLRIAGSNCLRWSQQHSPAVRHSRGPLSLSSSSSSYPSRSGGLINLSYKFLSTGPPSLRNNDVERTITRSSFSTTLVGFTDDDDDESDDEFVKRIQQLVDNFTDNDASDHISLKDHEANYVSAEPTWPAARSEPPPRLLHRDRDEIILASVERTANSVDLPLSLRIIKKKKKMYNLFREAVGESACCSVKKAFSSMVFILRELQSYTLQMRELLSFENLQGILGRVHGEMNASFVWLFQQIFSCTPTLMVYVMLLLANFTVHSISNNYALAAAVSPNPTHQSVAIADEDYQQKANTRTYSSSSSIKSSSIGSRTASVDSNGGSGGGTTKPVSGATDDGSYYGSGSSGVVIPEEEAVAWNMMLEEATRMQASARDESLMDHDTLQSFVSPVRIEVEADDYEEFARTEIMYHQALSLDPDNTLLLSNFAQFLYLVLHDHERAEYYFKRAVGIKPADAESLSRYASFLWMVRKDMGAAEETYLEAIAAEPGNTYYAANYAHFLWNTGGKDTCFPMDISDVC